MTIDLNDQLKLARMIKHACLLFGGGERSDEKVNGFLPRPLSLTKDNNGFIHIVAKVEGRPTITVWSGSPWETHRLGKPGMNPEFESISPKIENFFYDVFEAVANHEQEKIMAEEAKKRLEEEDHRMAVIDYLVMLDGNDV